MVGESGSGKTTLGLALLRLVSSEGPIVYLGNRIDGYDSKRMRPLRRDMQIVFQDPYGSLSPRLSVGQIIEEGLAIQNPRLTRAERGARVARALKEVGLDPACPRPVSARVLRRPAPAHRHCPRPGARAEIPHPRRADLGARRVGAGADRRSPARAAAPPQARLSVHQPRPESRARARQRDHRAPSRQGGGARPGARPCSPSRRPTTPRRCSPLLSSSKRRAATWSRLEARNFAVVLTFLGQGPSRPNERRNALHARHSPLADRHPDPHHHSALAVRRAALARRCERRLPTGQRGAARR